VAGTGFFPEDDPGPSIFTNRGSAFPVLGTARWSINLDIHHIPPGFITMNDEKSFQLFRNEDEEESKGDLKKIRRDTLSIVILLLVIVGALAVLGYAVNRPDSAEKIGTPVDPNMRKMDPGPFMIDLVTTIREFNDLLESIEDEEAFIITEVAFAGFVEEMENIANRSMGQSDEPEEEDREELYKMLGELEIQVKRLGRIEQHKRSDRELWKLIDPLHNRFESAMRMVPMIPPAGMPEDPVENPGTEKSEPMPEDPVENPGTEKSEPMPEDPVENPGTEKSEPMPEDPVENPGAIPDDPGTC
jgi:hypothetical protein